MLIIQREQMQPAVVRQRGQHLVARDGHGDEAGIVGHPHSGRVCAAAVEVLLERGRIGRGARRCQLCSSMASVWPKKPAKPRV